MSIFKPPENTDYASYSEIRERRQESQELEERWAKNQRGHNWLALSILLLILACGAMAVLVFPILADHQSALREHQSELSKLPGIELSVDALGKQVALTDANMEANEAEWSSRFDDLRKQMAKAFGVARAQAQDAASGALAKAQEMLAAQLGEVKTRVTGVETSRETDRASLDALEKELSQAKQEMAAQTQQLNALRGDLDRQVRQHTEDAAAAQRQLASVGQRQVRDRTDFDALATNVARKRIDFEVRRNQSTDIVPGISVAIHKTNVSYQRASGWVSAPDGRTIWLRDLRTQEPVVLVNSPDGRQQELVLTRISDNSVVGYVVLPATAVRGEPLAGLLPDGGREVLQVRQ